MFEFPQDANDRAGAVHPTANGNDFYVPTREQGSESITADLLTVATGGVAVRFPNIPCRKILIIAKRTNQGYIYIGGSNVSDTIYGAELGAGGSLTIDISNANLLYINSKNNGEGVSYFAI
jgi:hypothetical protein